MVVPERLVAEILAGGDGPYHRASVQQCSVEVGALRDRRPSRQSYVDSGDDGETAVGGEHPDWTVVGPYLDGRGEDVVLGAGDQARPVVGEHSRDHDPAGLARPRHPADKAGVLVRDGDQLPGSRCIR